MLEIKKPTQAALRRFIVSEAGQDVLSVLRDKTPSIKGGDQTSIIFESGKIEGWRKCIDAFLFMAENDNRDKTVEGQDSLQPTA